MIKKEVLAYLKEEGIRQVSSKTGIREEQIKFSGVFFKGFELIWEVYFILPTQEKAVAKFSAWDIKEKFGDSYESRRQGDS